MDNKNAIAIIIEKYLKGECNLDELKKALKIFSDPYHAFKLKPVLFWYWERNVDNNPLKQPSVENQERILDKIHHRINQHAHRVCLN